MNKIKFLLLAAMLSAFLISCTNEEPDYSLSKMPTTADGTYHELSGKTAEIANLGTMEFYGTKGELLIAINNSKGTLYVSGTDINDGYEEVTLTYTANNAIAGYFTTGETVTILLDSLIGGKITFENATTSTSGSPTKPYTFVWTS